jgi:hypothetical protein
MHQKWLKKEKVYFNKCVLDLDLASMAFSISSRKIKINAPYTYLFLTNQNMA